MSNPQDQTQAGELDQRLKALEIEFLPGVPVHLPDKAILQIKQVFEADGCVNLEELQAVLRGNEDDSFGTNYEGVVDDLIDLIKAKRLNLTKERK